MKWACCLSLFGLWLCTSFLATDAQAQAQIGRPAVWVMDVQGLLNEVSPEDPFTAIKNSYPRLLPAWQCVGNMEQTSVVFSNSPASSPTWNLKFTLTTCAGSVFTNEPATAAGYCRFFGQGNQANIRWVNGMDCICPSRQGTTANSGVFQWGTMAAYAPIMKANYENCEVAFTGTAPQYGIRDNVRLAFAFGKYSYTGKGKVPAYANMPEPALSVPADVCPAPKILSASGFACVNPDSAGTAPPATGLQVTPVPGSTPAPAPGTSLPGDQSCTGFFAPICELVAPIKNWFVNQDSDLTTKGNDIKNGSAPVLAERSIGISNMQFGMSTEPSATSSGNPASPFQLGATPACPVEKTISLFGTTVVVPTNKLCEQAGWIKGLFILMASIMAIRIASGGS